MASLGSQMARRPAVAIPTVTVEAEETIRVVIPPDTLKREEINTIIACLVSTLKVVPGTYIQAVETVYNIMQLSMPGLRHQMTDVKAVRLVAVKPTREATLEWLGLGEEGAGKDKDQLPRLAGPIVGDAKAVTLTEAVYAAVASVLFAMGRQASESASASALSNRPDALIRRFTIAEGDRLLLPGREAGPCRESLELIYNAFSVYTELRGEVVRYLIGVQRSLAHFPIHLEVILTNFHLMRNAGMTHVDAIMKLARMYPWTLKVPQLEPYWSKFVGDLRQFEQIDEDVRPYHRLLVPQSAFLFLSPDLAPLIAVAGHFIESVEKTFGGYVYRKDHYKELLDYVDQYVPGYTPTTQVSTLAALLGVSDVPLPKINKKKQEGEEEAVVV